MTTVARSPRQRMGYVPAFEHDSWCPPVHQQRPLWSRLATLLAVPTARAADDAATPTHQVTVVQVEAGGVDPTAAVPVQEIVDRVNGPVAEFWAEQTDGAVRFAAHRVRASEDRRP